MLKSDIIAFFRLQNYKDFLNPPNFLRKIFLFFLQNPPFFRFSLQISFCLKIIASYYYARDFPVTRIFADIFCP